MQSNRSSYVEYEDILTLFMNKKVFNCLLRSYAVKRESSLLSTAKRYRKMCLRYSEFLMMLICCMCFIHNKGRDAKVRLRVNKVV